jgi:hypothetical protein
MKSEFQKAEAKAKGPKYRETMIKDIPDTEETRKTRNVSQPTY